MSQHGRGSGPHDDDPDGEETEQERVVRELSLASGGTTDRSVRSVPAGHR